MRLKIINNSRFPQLSQAGYRVPISEACTKRQRQLLAVHTRTLLVLWQGDSFDQRCRKSVLRREGRSQHECGLRAQKADLDQTCADKPAEGCSAVTARR